MSAPSKRPVTILGGTGFLGRRVARHLRNHGFAVRIASRHPDRVRALFDDDGPWLQPVGADIRDNGSVMAAVNGAGAVVNAVSLYVEHGRDTFRAVHVDCARRAASVALHAGVERFVHVSGIGADETSGSPYIHSRGRGEIAVQAAFPGAVLIRPAVMFAPGDAFLTVILKLLRRSPVYPMFGSGKTRLQPVHAEDVAEAIARTVARTEAWPTIFELGGPQAYTFGELLRSIAREAGLKPALLPVPFTIWHGLAHVGELLANPPIVRNQVELMQIDSVTSSALPGLTDLGIVPQSVEAVVQSLLRRH
jgi:NADH dehydrogenase